MSDPGILYVVATPIGNLDDLSRRAIDTLSHVDTIAAEDVRHSKRLLQNFQITTRVVSYHDFSSDAAVRKILQQLEQGKSIALISDAGTPLISDPGYRLVRLARESGFEVLPVPGASAVITALSVAGLATDRFTFEGFLPSKTAARLKRLSAVAKETRTLVFYESPHRILASIEDMKSVFGDARQVFIARELTKKFESHFHGSLAHCLQWLEQDSNQQKGEFVVVIAGCDEMELEHGRQAEAMEMVRLLSEDVSMKKAVSLASRLTGARKNQLYDSALAELDAG